MEKLEIKVSRRTRMVNLPKQFISVEGENLQSKLVFSFVDEFVDGQARLEYETKEEKNFILLTKEWETYTVPVKNIITVAGEIDMQLVITEGTDEEEIPVFKSNKFYLSCNPSINAVDEAPDGYELWIEQANIKLNQIDNLDIDMKDSVVTIVKKDGTVVSENVKGDPGESGVYLGENPPENVNVWIDPTGQGSDVGPTDEVDPTVPDYVKTITEEDIYNWNNKSDFSGNYEDLKNKPVIPTIPEIPEIPKNLSEFNNDVGFLTSIPKEYITEEELNEALKDTATKNDIPDTSSFITKEVNNLSNYYNKTSIDEMIGNVGISLDAISGEVI